MGTGEGSDPVLLRRDGLRVIRPPRCSNGVSWGLLCSLRPSPSYSPALLLWLSGGGGPTLFDFSGVVCKVSSTSFRRFSSCGSQDGIFTEGVDIATCLKLPAFPHFTFFPLALELPLPLRLLQRMSVVFLQERWGSQHTPSFFFSSSRCSSLCLYDGVRAVVRRKRWGSQRALNLSSRSLASCSFFLRSSSSRLFSS